MSLLLPAVLSPPDIRAKVRRHSRLLVVGLLVLGWLAGPAASPAAAHARLVGSNPAEEELLDEVPTTVELVFDEDVEIIEDGIEVLGPDGEDVVAGAPELSDADTRVTVPLEVAEGEEGRGTYTVDWRVTSALDTHVIDGAFLFHVGEETGGDLSGSDDLALVDEAGWLGRWLGFVGSVTLVGAATLAALARTEAVVAERLRRLVLVGAAVAVLGVGLALVSRVAETAGRDLLDGFGRLPGALGESRSTELMSWRLGLLALAGLVAAFAWVWRRAPLAVAGIGVSSFLMASISGHAWAANPRGITVASDLAHFGAVAVWTGGILALLRALPVAEGVEALARRFSTVALFAVAVVLPAGLLLGWEQVGSLGDLTSTTYGRTVLAKATLFVALLALGWLNRARLVSLVERSVVPLTRSLRAEVVVAAVVLALTASLVNEPPPRSTGDSEVDEADDGTGSGKPVVATAAAEADNPDFAAELELHVSPATVGANELHLFFTDDAGDPLDVLVATAEVAPADGSPRSVDLSLLPPGHATASGVSLPSPGDWTVTVTVGVADLEGSVEFNVEVPVT